MNTIEIQKFTPWLIVSAALAIIFDYLFFDKLFGISVTIYGILMLGMLFLFAQQYNYPFKPAAWLAVPYLFFCLVPAIRANEFLIALNILAALGTYLLMVRAVTKDNVFDFSFLDYILTPILWPLKFLHRAFSTLFTLVRGAKGMPTGKHRQVLIGVLAALPVILFFGVLFASADLAFRQFVENTFTLQIPDTVIGQAVLISVIFVGCVGLFSYLANPGDKTSSNIADLLRLNDPEDAQAASAVGRPTENRRLEIGVFLSLIAALFLLFIIFQVQYLFGGAENITFGDFTYAEYARKGFGELLVVAFTTLLIILGIDHFSAREGSRKWLNIPALIVIAEVLVIMVSAFKRLWLYQAAYGLTEARLYVAGFIIMLAVIFLILVVKLLNNKKHSFFALGVLASMMLYIVGFSLLNPHQFIVEKNIAQFQGTDKLDVPYLTNLSADATPAMMRYYASVENEDELLKSIFLEEARKDAEDWQKHWQSWNLGRQNAAASLEQN